MFVLSKYYSVHECDLIVRGTISCLIAGITFLANLHGKSPRRRAVILLCRAHVCSDAANERIGAVFECRCKGVTTSCQRITL